eukprot:TRINITY_DN2539_c0_g1_i1.p1 TRINITY_DN2539_c0_g1~~TRINITY_DN2539_c0_g1_i1.p1  ORF type:complete len:165 (+),score=30.42 TRINITY_DN2539_c0_g1_i1:152-646(+)
MSQVDYASAEDWLLGRIGEVPSTALGWFRAGVGFYNKKEFNFSIECFQRSIDLDPYNYNAYQIKARACIAVNKRDEAIQALKKSVQLDNPSDWQLLVELTSQDSSADKTTLPTTTLSTSLSSASFLAPTLSSSLSSSSSSLSSSNTSSSSTIASSSSLAATRKG